MELGEILISLITALAGVKLVAAVLGIITASLVVVKALAALFLAIGNTGKLKDREDKFDVAGAWFQKVFTAIGAFLAWIGPGHTDPVIKKY